MIVVRLPRFTRQWFALPFRFLGLDQIVRVNAYHPSQRGFTLRLHVAGVGGDLQKRLCSVLHTPDDYGTNIDRIADGIIDLERSTFQRLQAARDLVLGVERIDPPKTRPVLGADVASEQQADQAFVGLKHDEALEDADSEEDGDDDR